MKQTSQHCCDKTMDGKMALYRKCCFLNRSKSWWIKLLSKVLGRAIASPPLIRSCHETMFHACTQHRSWKWKDLASCNSLEMQHQSSRGTFLGVAQLKCTKQTFWGDQHQSFDQATSSCGRSNGACRRKEPLTCCKCNDKNGSHIFSKLFLHKSH